MSETITVEVRFFASLKQVVGTNVLQREVPQGTTVAGLAESLALDYPKLPGAAGAIYAAVNRSYVGQTAELQDGDEVAFFPPVSGGQPTVKLFEITQAPLSMDDVARRVAGTTRGAISVFAGVVRGETAVKSGVAEDHGVLATDHLEYEAYAEMAEPMLAQIGVEVQKRWPQVEAVSIVHRVGTLQVGEASVVIAVASAHRQGVFDACSYAIERLKAVVPIWKKEVGSDGQWWVEGPGEGGAIQPLG